MFINSNMIEYASNDIHDVMISLENHLTNLLFFSVIKIGVFMDLLYIDEVKPMKTKPICNLILH